MIPSELFYRIIIYFDLNDLRKFRFLNKTIQKICKTYTVYDDPKILYVSHLDYIKFLSKCPFNFELNINDLIDYSTDPIIFRIYLNKINRKKLLEITESSFCKILERNLLDTYYNYCIYFNNVSTLYDKLASLLAKYLLRCNKYVYFVFFPKNMYQVSLEEVFVKSDIITDFILEEIDRIHRNKRYDMLIIDNICEYDINVYYRINYNKWLEHYEKYDYKYHLLSVYEDRLYELIYHTNKVNNLFKRYRDEVLMDNRKNKIYENKKEYINFVRNYEQYHYKCYDIDKQNNWHKMFWRNDNRREYNKMKKHGKYSKYLSNKQNYLNKELRKNFQQHKKDFIYDLY